MKRFFQKPHNLAAIAVIILTLIIASAAQNGDDASKAVAPTQSSRNEQGIQEAQHTSFENADSATAREEDWKAIRDDALQRAAGYAEAEEYKMAIAVLNEALKKLPGDEELSDALDKYQNDNRIIVRTNSIAAAKEAAENADYAEALKRLKTALTDIGDDVELSAMYANYADAYRQLLRERAKKAYDSNDYQESLSILQNGLLVLNNDTELMRLFNAYQKAAPSSFSNMTQFHHYLDDVGDLYSTKKELFHDAFLPWAPSEPYTMVLNGEYEKASGILVWDLREIDHSGLSHPTIRFHGDGKDLLVASVDCQSGSADFEVDLTGVIYLEIYLTNFYESWPGVGRYAGIADFNFYQSIVE